MLSLFYARRYRPSTGQNDDKDGHYVHLIGSGREETKDVGDFTPVEQLTDLCLHT